MKNFINYKLTYYGYVNAIPWLTCKKCREFPGRIAAKCLEAQDGGHGFHWLPRQKKKINDEQKHNDKAFHQDTEPLIDTLVQMRMVLTVYGLTVSGTKTVNGSQSSKFL